MRLISLNVWVGRQAKPLLEFLKRHAGSTDIFCFQEMMHQGTPKTMFYGDEHAELLTAVREVLPEHEGFFHPAQDGEFGLATFVRKGIEINQVEEMYIYRRKDAMEGKDGSTLGKNMQYFKVRLDGKEMLICNIHGLWAGPNIGKGDRPERIEQSNNIVEFLNKESCSKLLCGDFNLWPDTESMAIIERTGLRNLITEYGITSTRTHLYTYENKYADYVLVSPEISVQKFEVLQDVVSDHLPLLVDFGHRGE